MRRPTLRRRLYLVLLQWFLLFVVAAALVLWFSFTRIRQNLVEDRLLLARTIAHSLDATISSSLQQLGQLAADLDLDGDVAGRLRTFRFHSPFREATYVLDTRGVPVARDPGQATPIPAEWLQPREVVTPLVRKAGGDHRAVLALVQPFRHGPMAYYLVAEMNPLGSIVSAFLQDLGPDPERHVVVADDRGVIIAAPDRTQLFRTLPQAALYGERMRAHRPAVIESARCDFPSSGHDRSGVLDVMAPLRFAPWGVVVETHEAKALSGLYTARRGTILAGLLLALTGLVLARALSRSIVSPIRHLSREAEAIRSGELSHPITVSGDHEVEVLARTLDEARQRLASTLRELSLLNEDLENQVASRTRAVEAKYLDLQLLHAVAQLSTQEREPARVVPAVLRLIVEHAALPVAAIVTHPPDHPAVTYVVPVGATVPGLGEELPPDWQRRPIVYQERLVAELFHPRRAELDERVMGALEHQLAISLHGADLWQRTVEQDEQRRVLVRRLLGATEEERRRIARELHDETAQLLTVIQLSLEHVPVDTPEMSRAKALLVRTQQDIHRIIYDLRPSLLDDLGLAAAIQSYAEEHLGRHGVQVSVETGEDLPARPEIDLPMFRIYQELVTNVLRHAQAEHVSIELDERDGNLILDMEDDGVGFDPAEKSGSAGLTGMRERATLVNGGIRFDSEPGMGTHVVVEIPVP